MMTVEDSLHNLVENCSLDYGRGLIVGLVSAFMRGSTFPYTIVELRSYCNEAVLGAIPKYLPESWIDEWNS